jgi:acetylornithine deacetylase/succinyl-diaminopimelate desuccinylase-like protein
MPQIDRRRARIRRSISTADKGGVGIVLTARGTSTHSSMPRPDNAIFTLSKAMAKLADYDTKVQLTPAALHADGLQDAGGTRRKEVAPFRLKGSASLSGECGLV